MVPAPGSCEFSLPPQLSSEWGRLVGFTWSVWGSGKDPWDLPASVPAGCMGVEVELWEQQLADTLCLEHRHAEASRLLHPHLPLGRGLLGAPRRTSLTSAQSWDVDKGTWGRRGHKAHASSVHFSG